MNTLRERLISAREEAGLTQAELRRACKIKSSSTLNDLESGKRTQSPQLPVIAAALGVEVLWLQHGTGKKRRSDTPPLPELDILTQPVFPLRCPECGKVSHKSFIELEMNDRLPCSHCAIIFNINDQYGHGELEMFLKATGRSGFILRQNRKFD